MKKTMIVGVVACALMNSFALTHNLLYPWKNAPRCSPPQTPMMSFYSKVSDTMLFTDTDVKKDGLLEFYCQATVRAYDLSWTLHRNMFTTPLSDAVLAEAIPGNLFKIVINTKNLEPGFYDIRTKFACGFDQVNLFDPNKGVKPEGVCTFGWNIDKMQIPDSKPADFKAFWANALSEYKKIPVDVKIESEKKIFKGKEIDDYNLESACMPGNFDPRGTKYDEVVSYKVSWAGPDGGRVYAWVAHPNIEGKKFPALYVLPGAGTSGRPRPLDHARHGYFAMDVQVHGFDVEVEGRPKVPGYNGVPPLLFDNPAKFCWYNIYLRAWRGVDALVAMSEVDATKIVTVGGSQGGRLSYVVSSLDKRVAATIPCIAHGANMPHLFLTRKMNAERNPGQGVATPAGDRQEDKCEAYFDPMNFSPDVTCPIFANAGLIDPVSPAYSTWAVFQRAGSKNKTFNSIPGHGHDWFAAFDKRAYAWLEKILSK